MTVVPIVRPTSDVFHEETLDEAEAIVVGSGFGGAVAACRLAQAGIDVLVLERGRRYEASDFPALPVESALLPEFARWSWQQGGGLWDVADLEEMLSVQAAGYGGGSLIYANVHLRPPLSVFDDKWPVAYRSGRALEQFYDLAASMLEVAPIDAHETLAEALIKPDQMRKVARHIGREDGFFHPPLALSFRDGLNAHGREQRKCTGCGSCCTGCPETAKNSLDLNYLAVAEDNGARVATQCEVINIEQLPDRTWRLDCVDHLAGRRRRFKARYLFLCAGSVHSTRLLAGARLGPCGRQAQSLAGIGYFPNADALGVVYDTTHPQYPSFGPAITTSTVCQDSAEDPGAFFLIQDGGYARELERLMGVLRGPAWLGRNRLTRQSLATADPSHRPPPPSQLHRGHGAPLVSPLDDLLDALAGGAFTAVISDAARSDWSALLGEIKELLLLPEIVGRTIELSLHDRLERCWLTSWLKPHWPITRWLVAFGRWMTGKVMGTDEVLADHALRALLTGANLRRGEIARRVLGYGGEKVEHRVVLLAMGRDAVPGQLVHDRQRDRLIADLDLYHLVPRYTNEEQVMAEMGRAMGGELRTNPAWAFLGKPISVHSQGGCRMSDEPTGGVTTSDGQVHGCDGLYILDGSILPTSVGVNPSATIAAIAERNILQFIRRYKGNEDWPAEDGSPGADQYKRQRKLARRWSESAHEKGWAIRPPRASNRPFEGQPLGLAFQETMEGYYAPIGGAPTSESEYRRLETLGRPHFPLALKLDVSVENLARFFEDCRHEMRLSGSVTLRLPHAPRGAQTSSYPVNGRLELFVQRTKQYGIGAGDDQRRLAQERAMGSRYTTIVGDPQRHEKREMKYELDFTDHDGNKWVLRGHKSVRDDPGLDAWRHLSSLFVSLLGPAPEQEASGNSAQPQVHRGAGVVHVDVGGFTYHQLASVRITPAGVDPARAMWARMKFGTFFFGTLQRIYLPELRPALAALFKSNPSNVQRESKFGSAQSSSERADGSP